MKIQFSRGKDKKDVLSIVRSDGSRSWQHQQPGIPAHDLTHYAVESELGLRDAFFGLVAKGWDITRLTDRDVRSMLPLEGLWAEFVVGLIQTERLASEPLSADEFNDMLTKELRNRGLVYDRRITEDELFRIRRTFMDIYSSWRLLKPSESITLEFISDPQTV